MDFYDRIFNLFTKPLKKFRYIVILREKTFAVCYKAITFVNKILKIYMYHWNAPQNVY